MDWPEYERLVGALRRGHTILLRGARYTDLGALDAALGSEKPLPPPENPREARERELAEWKKPALTARAGELSLPKSGTLGELRAVILDAEFPVTQETDG